MRFSLPYFCVFRNRQRDVTQVHPESLNETPARDQGVGDLHRQPDVSLVSPRGGKYFVPKHEASVIEGISYGFPVNPAVNNPRFISGHLIRISPERDTQICMPILHDSKGKIVPSAPLVAGEGVEIEKAWQSTQLKIAARKLMPFVRNAKPGYVVAPNMSSFPREPMLNSSRVSLILNMPRMTPIVNPRRRAPVYRPHLSR